MPKAQYLRNLRHLRTHLTKEKRMRENVKQQRQIIQTGSIKGLHAAKTGRKPNKRIAQSNALGTVDPLFCALKEQKEDERKGTSLTPVAHTARQLVNERSPRAFALGYIPFGASPRLCSKPFTSVQCLEVLSCGLRPAVARNINCCTLSWNVIQACQRHNICEICVICERILQRKNACEKM